MSQMTHCGSALEKRDYGRGRGTCWESARERAMARARERAAREREHEREREKWDIILLAIRWHSWSLFGMLLKKPQHLHKISLRFGAPPSRCDRNHLSEPTLPLPNPSLGCVHGLRRHIRAKYFPDFHCLYIYICIWRSREREKELPPLKLALLRSMVVLVSTTFENKILSFCWKNTTDTSFHSYTYRIHIYISICITLIYHPLDLMCATILNAGFSFPSGKELPLSWRSFSANAPSN